MEMFDVTRLIVTPPMMRDSAMRYLRLLMVCAALAGCRGEKPDPRLCPLCLKIREAKGIEGPNGEATREALWSEREKKWSSLASYELLTRGNGYVDCPDCLPIHDKAIEHEKALRAR